MLYPLNMRTICAKTKKKGFDTMLTVNYELMMMNAAHAAADYVKASAYIPAADSAFLVKAAAAAVSDYTAAAVRIETSGEKVDYTAAAVIAAAAAYVHKWLKWYDSNIDDVPRYYLDSAKHAAAAVADIADGYSAEMFTDYAQAAAAASVFVDIIA